MVRRRESGAGHAGPTIGPRRMDIDLILLVLQLSLALIVFSVALGAAWQDLTYLLRHPGLLIRSLVSDAQIQTGEEGTTVRIHQHA